jgi:ribosomal-protein-alanine N-acetyltransferase
MLKIDFYPFPDLETGRLRLRRPELHDAGEMYKYRSDPGFMRYIPHRLAKSMEDVTDAVRFINNRIDNAEGINWAICLKDDPATIIGMVGYVVINRSHHRAEIGYVLHTPYHGTGIIAEATQCAIDYGFTVMKLHSIEAVVNVENIPSKKLLEKLGFSKDAFFKDYLHHEGRYMDANVYSLIKPAL